MNSVSYTGGIWLLSCEGRDLPSSRKPPVCSLQAACAAKPASCRFTLQTLSRPKRRGSVSSPSCRQSV